LGFEPSEKNTSRFEFAHLDGPAGPVECFAMDTSGRDSRPEQWPITAGHARNLKQTLQAAKLQRFAYDSAMSLRTACTRPGSDNLVIDSKTGTGIHKLVGAWDLAADRLRVLRGRGLPANKRNKALW